VSTSRLRDALDQIRSENGRPEMGARIDLVKALADGLGISQSDVTGALDKLRTQHENAFADDLAKELGLDSGKVRAALAKVKPAGVERAGRPGPPPGGPMGGPRPDGPPLGGPPPGGPPLGGPPPGGPPPGGHFGLRRGPDAFAGKLANELGVSRSDLRAALEKLHPAGPMREPDRGGPDRAGFVDDLAEALGADPAKVRSILEKLHGQAESRMQAQRDKFAAALADKLGLPVQKVTDALDSVPHHWRRAP
jgi:predicted transcriptional regulator